MLHMVYLSPLLGPQFQATRCLNLGFSGYVQRWVSFGSHWIGRKDLLLKLGPNGQQKLCFY